MKREPEKTQVAKMRGGERREKERRSKRSRERKRGYRNLTRVNKVWRRRAYLICGVKRCFQSPYQLHPFHWLCLFLVYLHFYFCFL